jgi:drug/metabolite transporter (DMT)-like permease
MLNFGLIYSTPSVFQMVRSSIVGFSAVFSFLFLSRRFLGHEWVSVITVLGGIGLISYHGADEVSDWTGPLLLLFSQVFVACQFILEEYLMDRYQMDPVRAMGIEGVFGTVLLGLALIVAAFSPSAVGSVFDIKTGVSQLFDHETLWQSALLLSFMVAIFNFFGLAVSTTVGIPGRSVLDAIR